MSDPVRFMYFRDKTDRDGRPAESPYVFKAVRQGEHSQDANDGQH
jgi:hypothetical protein